MKYSFEEDKGIGIFRLRGEMDLYSSGRLKRAFDAQARNGFRSFLIDAQGLTYIDSSGLGVLISIVSK